MTQDINELIYVGIVQTYMCICNIINQNALKEWKEWIYTLRKHARNLFFFFISI